jgi:hypothetical protein
MAGCGGAGEATIVPGPRDGRLKMRVQGFQREVVKAFNPSLLPDHVP